MASQTGTKCVFPFMYKGVEHTKCTTIDSTDLKPWCAINIEPAGEVLWEDVSGDNWAYCGTGCTSSNIEISQFKSA